jgi:GNAT superfamily N-acetyltransferase
MKEYFDSSVNNYAISFRKGVTVDSGQIADLICQAYSNAIFDFMSIVESGLGLEEIIEKMLRSGLGHAKPGNAILAESGDVVAGMVFIVPPERHDYSPYDLSAQWENAYGSFFNPLFAGSDSYCIHSFAVRPKFRKMGIGKALLLLSKQCAREEGYSKMTVGTSESNPASHRAYESAGFSVIGSELSVGMDILECVI